MPKKGHSGLGVEFELLKLNQNLLLSRPMFYPLNLTTNHQKTLPKANCLLPKFFYCFITFSKFTFSMAIKKLNKY